MAKCFTYGWQSGEDPINDNKSKSENIADWIGFGTDFIPSISTKCRHNIDNN